MLEDEKYINKDAVMLQAVRMLVYGCVWIALIFFTSVSGCVMYSDSVEAEQTKAETEQIKEQAKITKIKIDAVSALIGKGVNPIAARCAIMGYTIAVSNVSGVINPCAQFLNTDGKQGEELR